MEKEEALKIKEELSKKILKSIKIKIISYGCEYYEIGLLSSVFCISDMEQISSVCKLFNREFHISLYFDEDIETVCIYIF